MRIIKLKDLLHEIQLKEAPVADLPPQVKFVSPPAQVAYAKAAGDSAGKPYTQPNIDFSGIGKSDDLITKASNVIKQFENNKNDPNGGYNKKLKKWFPHKSLEGGRGTIAYGHKIQSGDPDFSQGLTDDDAVKLLEKDINKKIDIAKRQVKDPTTNKSTFDSLPMTVKIAVVNALYRGDISKDTMSLLGQNKFSDAVEKYLDDPEYRRVSNKSGVKKRMNWNAEMFRSAS